MSKSQHKKRKPTHPGAILRADVLPELGITQGALAKHLGVSRRTISEIINERRPMTADMALRLAYFLNTTPHNLQSQLGYTIRANSKPNMSLADQNTVQGYQAAQSSLRSDMDSFLNSKDPSLAAQYQQATDNWNENVSPYLRNTAIAKIAQGKITNPKNITNIFQSPEPDVQKVVEDLGPQANNKILYSELGKSQYLNPDKLVNAVSALNNKKLGSYVTPTFEEQLANLAARIKGRNATQRIAGGALGVGIAKNFAHVPMLLEGAAALGGYAGPAAMRTIQNILPVQQIGNTISNAAKAAYPIVSKAVIANNVPGNQ